MRQGPPRTTKSVQLAKKQVMRDIEERCADIAKRRGVNLFETLLDYVQGDWEKLGYKETRDKMTKDGSVISEPTITPEMRFAATKEALRYVAPQLSAIAIHDLQDPNADESGALKPASREDIINAIRNDPFFQVQEGEIIDITPEESQDHKDPFK